MGLKTLHTLLHPVFQSFTFLLPKWRDDLCIHSPQVIKKTPEYLTTRENISIQLGLGDYIDENIIFVMQLLRFNRIR